MREMQTVKEAQANLSEELSPLVSSKVILHIRAVWSSTISRAKSEICLRVLRFSVCPLSPTSSVVKPP